MEVEVPNTSPEEREYAKNRGERAKRLFDVDESGTKQIMKDIIKALKQEELHIADPHNPNKPSGKPDFYKACWAAIPTESFSQGEQTDADKAAFIDDLWKTAMSSRRAQSTIPCW